MVVTKQDVTEQEMGMDMFAQVVDECERVIDECLYSYEAGGTVEVRFHILQHIFAAYNIKSSALDRIVAVLAEKYTNAEWRVAYRQGTEGTYSYLEFS